MEANKKIHEPSEKTKQTPKKEEVIKQYLAGRKLNRAQRINLLQESTIKQR